MRARDLLELMGDAAFGVRLGELVDAECEPLGEPPVVDEDDRRAVGTDELEQRRVDRGPDRADVRLVPGVHLHSVLYHRLRQLVACVEFAHVLDRDHDLEVELLALAGVHERDLAPGAGDEAPDLGERPLRGREPDPLERSLDDLLEPLERDREVRSALRAGDGVHLVEDERLDAPQDLAPLRGEEQEQRLGSRDENVGRSSQHPLPVALRRVAGAHTDRELRAEPGEGAAEVPLDVVVERLQR